MGARPADGRADDGPGAVAAALSRRYRLPLRAGPRVRRGRRAPGDAWTASADAQVAVYDSWRFRTGPNGDFATLARRLRPGGAGPGLGRAPLSYPRVPAAPDLAVRGALAPLDSEDAELPPEIAADLACLTTPLRDERGRVVVGLPVYGAAWRADPGSTEWGGRLNGDPRHRGVAGVGLMVGIERQDELVTEAAELAGAMATAAQRLRDLTLGLVGAGALWVRRFPTDPRRRLWVLGPALRRARDGRRHARRARHRGRPPACPARSSPRPRDASCARGPHGDRRRRGRPDRLP